MQFYDGVLDETEFRYFLTGPVGEILVKNNPVDWID